MVSAHCHACNAVVTAHAAFCSTCGTRLSAGSLLAKSAADVTKRLDAASHTARLIGGRYRLETSVTTTTMGALWRGRDEQLNGRLCAIKSFTLEVASQREYEAGRAQLNHAAQVLSELHHPAICELRDVVTEGIRHYLILEWIEGWSLAGEVANRGKPGLAEPLVLTWAQTLCDALDYMHSQQPPVIFRDLRPHNVLVRSDGRLSLIDFGIARSLTALDRSAKAERGYGPSEQQQGVEGVRSDVYALAATLHHLLTGSDPSTHAATSYPDVRTVAPKVSERVAMALNRALSPDSTERFATVAAFAQALLNWAPVYSSVQMGLRDRGHRATQSIISMDELDLLVATARRTNTHLPHLLFVNAEHGEALPQRMAEALAAKLGTHVHTVIGANLLHPDDVASLLAGMQRGDILYIDDVNLLRAPTRAALVAELDPSTVPYNFGADFSLVAGMSGADPVDAALAALFSVVLDCTTLEGTQLPSMRDDRSVPTREEPWFMPRELVHLDVAGNGSKGTNGLGGTAALSTEPVAEYPRNPVLVVVPRDVRQFLIDIAKSAEQVAAARVVHPPPDVDALAKLKGIEPSSMLPLSLARYVLQATFFTSVGPVHEENATGEIVLDASRGAAVEPSLSHYAIECVHHAGRWHVQDEDEIRTRGSAEYPPSLSSRVLIDRARDAVIVRHTRQVACWGAKGQFYKKLCVPEPRDVQLEPDMLVRTYTARVTVTVGDESYALLYAPAPNGSSVPVVLQTDLPARIPLCQQCGLLDDRDTPCSVCARFVCSRCAPPGTLGFCSTKCEKEHLQRVALLKISEPMLSEMVRDSGEEVIHVVSEGGNNVVLTRQAAYVAGNPPVHILCSTAQPIAVRRAGGWRRRRWAIALGSPSWQVAEYDKREDAEAFAEILRSWCTTFAATAEDGSA